MHPRKLTVHPDCSPLWNSLLPGCWVAVKMHDGDNDDPIPLHCVDSARTGSAEFGTGDDARIPLPRPQAVAAPDARSAQSRPGTRAQVPGLLLRRRRGHLPSPASQGKEIDTSLLVFAANLTQDARAVQGIEFSTVKCLKACLSLLAPGGLNLPHGIVVQTLQQSLCQQRSRARR
jgi:hypothetical protein